MITLIFSLRFRVEEIRFIIIAVDNLATFPQANLRES
jgi:hypothetical protein